MSLTRITDGIICHSPASPDSVFVQTDYSPAVWTKLLALCSTANEVDITGIEDDQIQSLVSEVSETGTRVTEYDTANSKGAKRIKRELIVADAGMLIFTRVYKNNTEHKAFNLLDSIKTSLIYG
jgi:hypothetical protein